MCLREMDIEPRIFTRCIMEHF